MPGREILPSAGRHEPGLKTKSIGVYREEKQSFFPVFLLFMIKVHSFGRSAKYFAHSCQRLNHTGMSMQRITKNLIVMFQAYSNY